MLGDEIAWALPELRANAESMMTTWWRVERATGATQVVDFRTVPIRDVVYEGKGKLQTYEGHEAARPAGPSTVVQQRMTIHFPVGSFTPEPGDVATCLGSTDPLLVGRRFRIVQRYPVKEHATAYRVFVDETLEG